MLVVASVPHSGVGSAYVRAKTDKMDLVEHDVPRLGWWGRFFASQGIHHLQAVTPDAIDRKKLALRRAGRQPATIQRYLAVLRHLFQLAIRRWQLVDRNPVFAVDWPKAPPYNARIPTRLERQRLLAAAEPFFRPFILVGMYTGLRKGSILRLEAENYLSEPGILRVIQKGGRELKLPMTPPLKKVLDGLGIAAGLLFHWPDGRVVHRFPRKAWARACLKAGLYVEKPDTRNPKKTRKGPVIRFHDLRHCMETVLAEAGVGPPPSWRVPSGRSIRRCARLTPAEIDTSCARHSRSTRCRCHAAPRAARPRRPAPPTEAPADRAAWP
jgi:integrase